LAELRLAAGRDPVEIAARLGDRVETVLAVYVHEFDACRRSAQRRAALEARYGEQPSEAFPALSSRSAAKDGYQHAATDRYRS
jgi:hypothetical protein